MTSERLAEPRADALRAAAAGVDNRLKAAALGAAMVGAALYPLLLDTMLHALGVRLVSGVVLLLSVASALHQLRRRASSWMILTRLAAAVLADASMLTASTQPLLLLPSLVYATLAGVFLASLQGDVSLVERGARLIQPVAPDFIGTYCRRVTELWGVLLLVLALVLGALALIGAPSVWRSAAGAYTWGLIALVSAAEFLVRKTYFRNYWYGGPFERVWSRLFPAEATEMGRRSAAYIRMVRERLGELDR